MSSLIHTYNFGSFSIKHSFIVAFAGPPRNNLKAWQHNVTLQRRTVPLAFGQAETENNVSLCCRLIDRASVEN